jgi:hypothetical protein
MSSAYLPHKSGHLSWLSALFCIKIFILNQLFNFLSQQPSAVYSSNFCFEKLCFHTFKDDILFFNRWHIHTSGPRNPKLTAVGIRCADHATPSIRKRFALIWPASGCRSVGIVRLRTKKPRSLVLVVYMRSKYFHSFGRLCVTYSRFSRRKLVSDSSRTCPAMLLRQPPFNSILFRISDLFPRLVVTSCPVSQIIFLLFLRHVWFVSTTDTRSMMATTNISVTFSRFARSLHIFRVRLRAVVSRYRIGNVASYDVILCQLWRSVPVLLPFGNISN